MIEITSAGIYSPAKRAAAYARIDRYYSQMIAAQDAGKSDAEIDGLVRLVVNCAFNPDFVPESELSRAKLFLVAGCGRVNDRKLPHRGPRPAEQRLCPPLMGHETDSSVSRSRDQALHIHLISSHRTEFTPAENGSGGIALK